MFCTNCGHEIKENTNFCRVCGQLIENSDVQRKQPQQSNSPKTKPVLGKNSKLLFGGLAIAIVVLIVLAIVLMIKLSISSPIEGMWANDEDGQVLEFAKNGNVVFYSLEIEVDGEYLYDKNSGQGDFELDKEDFDFEVDGDDMEVNGDYDYYRVIDEDFEIYEFIDKYVEVGKGIQIVKEKSIQEISPTPEATQQQDLNPTPLETVIPEEELTNDDEQLRVQLTQHTWFGYYKYASDGSEVYKDESDYYEFADNGTFLYQYVGSQEAIYGSWVIEDGYLLAVYDNSDIGTVMWLIEFYIEDGVKMLLLYDTRAGYEGGFWIYADSPA